MGCMLMVQLLPRDPCPTWSAKGLHNSWLALQGPVYSSWWLRRLLCRAPQAEEVLICMGIGCKEAGRDQEHGSTRLSLPSHPMSSSLLASAAALASVLFPVHNPVVFFTLPRWGLVEWGIHNNIWETPGFCKL